MAENRNIYPVGIDFNMTSSNDIIVGIDLSGPANTADTAVACFDITGDHLIHRSTDHGATDQDITDIVLATDAARVVIGLDAPLSYNPGGGSRPADTALRKLLIKAGMHPGSVMSPTMTRMAYLTLRGISVARSIQAVRPDVLIVEIHPGGTMALRGADVATVRAMKSDGQARHDLIRWLAGQGLAGLPEYDAEDHVIAAYAAVLAAWKWSTGKSAWCWKATSPDHPFDFAC